MAFCPRCGKPALNGAFFCTGCGSNLKEHSTQPLLSKTSNGSTSEPLPVSVVASGSDFHTQTVEFFGSLSKRLSKEGFRLEKDVTIGPYVLGILALGNIKPPYQPPSIFTTPPPPSLPLFVAGAAIESADVETIQRFDSQVWDFAGKNKLGQCRITLIASEDFSDEVKSWVVNNPGKFNWVNVGIRVLASMRLRETYYGKVRLSSGEPQKFAKTHITFEY